ncbi:MAG: thiamine phosphate synthase [Gammaproteobacteria bacterium]|jgi:thiamine-phosphate pyrophosphorylase
MRPLFGLYVITAAQTSSDDVAAAIRGGAAIVQYRDKSGDTARRLREAAAFRQLCSDNGVLFIVNDDLDLAAAVGADGVHVGREDAGCVMARERLGDSAIVGVSCYNDFARARSAAQAGADYIAFGAFFGSPTKPEAPRATPSLLERAKRELGLPVVAIGGITPQNGASLIAAGADMLAAISAVFSQPDIEDASRRFSDLFLESSS